MRTKYRLSLAFLAVSSLLATAPAGPVRADDPPAPSRQAAKDDLKTLQGAWVCVKMEREGDEIPAESYQGSEAVYEDDRVTLFREGGVFRRGLVTLDPSKTPKRVNTWDLGGPYEDQTVPGIYAIDGDTLKLCFSRPGAERPADFSTKKGSGLLSIVYKRKKP